MRTEHQLVSTAADGWAMVQSAPRPFGDSIQLEVDIALPYEPKSVSGLFFLARCGINRPADRFTQWNDYAPIALYAVMSRPGKVRSPDHSQPEHAQAEHSQANCSQTTPTVTRWTLLMPLRDDPRHAWLASRIPGDPLLLHGPYGNRFEPASNGARRNLLIITDSGRALGLLDTVNRFMDQGGKVTLMCLIQQTEPDFETSSPVTGPPLTGSSITRSNIHEVMRGFPIQTEIRLLPVAGPGLSLDGDALHSDAEFTDLIRWADLLIMTVHKSRLATLALHTYRKRFQAVRARKQNATDGDASEYAYVDADYICGYGSCLACTVPTAQGGVTRACLHGPVFPLSTLISP